VNLPAINQTSGKQSQGQSQPAYQDHLVHLAAVQVPRVVIAKLIKMSI